ncbi:MAG: alpha-amylase family glycosyl hydrolase, partial [Thermoanaerobaculia bacterium]
YSPDQSWMTRLVLLAKNTYVWLYQLSREHGRVIQRLDQIPDEALETIARRGFSGLWLIGLWERSPASKRIKELCGNPEAVASAYSVKSYSIAGDLGGDEALQNLQERARSHGIRLAADMVPNHMGIDSDWLLDHPDRFVTVADPPFSTYTFDGPDLSPRADVGIVLEDHYYDRSDAAVVFKRIDHGSGEPRYVYHGNDGTSMPWNDTAQLDYRRHEVREAVIATIVDVARRFPVIRFDAAMTLARKHFQRLWFPELGGSDAIPTRAAHAMTREDFDREMPREFWREVVDRVASEAPNTLLLAEAFWLMEGYFVRTLGMHRVYNSAFMHMLRDEENAKFRLLVKETLAFDPRILERYVNFMSNPDERTAVDQFGREDRYFGVCVLMATLPGLPMFAHGQVEGLTEKYGMEYRQAYVREETDADLVARHERVIAPLLRRRELFAGADSFLFYDCIDDNGQVNEDVFAFSNASGTERALVLFNNRYAHAHGHIRGSAPFRVRNGDGTGEHQTRNLAAALALGGEETFVHFTDSISGLHYLVRNRDLAERGLELDLNAFEYRVLHGFRELRDDDSHTLARLADRLAGRGVQDMEVARREIELEPIRLHLRQALTSERVGELTSLSTAVLEAQRPEELLAGLSGELRELANEIAPHGEADPELKGHRERAERRLLALTTLPLLAARLSGSTTPRIEEAGRALEATLISTPELAPGLYGWIVIELARDLWGAVAGSAATYEELDAKAALVSGLVAADIDPERAERTALSLILGLEEGWGQRSRETGAGSATDLMQTLLDRHRARGIIGVHSVRGQEWIHKESLEGILVWRWVLEILAWSSATERRARDLPAAIADWWEIVIDLNRKAEEAGFRIDRRRLDSPAD